MVSAVAELVQSSGRDHGVVLVVLVTTFRAVFHADRGVASRFDVTVDAVGVGGGGVVVLGDGDLHVDLDAPTTTHEFAHRREQEEHEWGEDHAGAGGVERHVVVAGLIEQKTCKEKKKKMKNKNKEKEKLNQIRNTHEELGRFALYDDFWKKCPIENRTERINPL